MPDRFPRAALKHVSYGEMPRTEETLSTYAQAARIMRRRTQEAAAS